MVINCKECSLPVSDQAFFCPHCGLPMKANGSPPKRKISNKRKRLPNGFGQIVKINQNLRNPYRAMVHVGKTSSGKYISKILKPQGYFQTYNDAYAALVEYNKNPYDLDQDITVAQCYEKWSEKYFEGIAKNSTRTITSAWAYCSAVYDMRLKDLRARHIKGCMEEGTANIKGEERTPSPSTQSRIKSLFNLMLDYALEYELVDKNYARTFEISDDLIDEIEENSKSHIPFTDNEIQILWDNIDKIQYVDLLLYQCYSGWRPQELGLIELDQVDFDNMIVTGGMKTDSGKDRVVPIHTLIEPIVRRMYQEAIKINSKYLVNCTDTQTHRSSYKMTYDKYRHRVKNIVEALRLNPEHRAHDGRKHFVTMAKKYNVDEYAIKYIVGHKIEDLTERIYTEREISWLKTEIQKIK